MSVVKKAFNAVGLGAQTPRLETKVPALAATREAEVGADDISIGTDDTNTVKGKRGLVRPVASSIGGV